ncbi:MAG TPA: MFS transporter, partial [Lacunisphaera sp.]|nr:MFS transporter [Lacunisphaera sp.]
MISSAPAPIAERPTRARHGIVFFLFLITTINYADRATLSIVGPALKSEFKLDAVTLGYLLSAFSWTYTALQIPGGWLLDR